MENLIQFLSRYEVTPKWLLKNHARVPRTPRLVESLNYRGEHAVRNCEIVGRVLRLAERLEQLIEGRGVLIIAVDILQHLHQFRKSCLIHTAMLRDTVVRSRAELVQIPSRLGYAQHGHIQISAFHHRLQRRENLLVSQVAGGSEEDQRV